ncbi:MAG: LysR family transcriptional regulator [Bacteroidota bacterium]
MEVKYLKLVKTIAEEGNIANSSEKLFLTQSALSHQLRELEDQLGFKVFLRKRGKWELTEEGRELHQLADHVLEAIESGFQKIKSIRDHSTGTVRLSMECYSFYQGISNFMQRMGILYPEIKVDLILEGTHHPVSKLMSNEIDAAVLTSKPNIEDLTCIKIFEDEIFALIHKEHPISQAEYLNPEDFRNLHLIIHSYPLETVAVHEHFLKSQGIVPKMITAIPLTEVALDLVYANQGITCLPKWGLKSFKTSEDILLKRLGSQGLKRDHYLTVRSADLSKKYMADFVSNFTESFEYKERAL